MIPVAQWAALAAIIDEGWPGRFEPAAEDAWRVTVDEFDADQILAALKRMISQGARFRPSIAELVAEIRRDPTQPTFSEAMILIFERGGVLAARTTVRKATWDDGERAKLDDAAAWDRAGEMHPLIRAFVRTQGLDRLRRMKLRDEYGELRRKELEQKWNELVDTTDHRQLVALGAARSGGQLRSIDPLAALQPRLKLAAPPTTEEAA